MTFLQTMLSKARIDLVDASTNLSVCRKLGFPQDTAIAAFCEALDRAWDIQCMVQGSPIAGGQNVQG